MVKITSALVEEHREFRSWFDRLEGLLPTLERLEEVQRLARQIELGLRRHAAIEEDLALLVLEHVPEQRRRCDRFYTEHQEIDSHLTQVQQARGLPEACALLRRGLAVSRRHFQHEERFVFPLLEAVAGMETLERLGAIWERQREGAPGLDVLCEA